MTDLAQMFAETERQYGLPPGYLMRTAQIESGLNPNAKNPNSSAAGLFQFINSTAANYGLANPMDPVASTDAAGRLARDNAAFLERRLGRKPTAAELYLAHQQGAGGAAALLTNPDASASATVGGAATRFNGGQEGQTAGQFANYWTDKFGGSAMPSTSPSGGVGGPGQTPLAFGPIGQGPAASVFGQLATDWMTRQRDQQNARAEQDQLRRSALFGGPAAQPSGLAALYR